MPRFSQRGNKKHAYKHKTRKMRRSATKKRNTRRQKQRGGGLKEDLIHLITHHPDYSQVVGYLHNQIEFPIVHPNFPIKDVNEEGVYTMMVYGDPHDNVTQMPVLIMRIQKEGAHFTDITFDMPTLTINNYLEEHGNPELMPMNFDRHPENSAIHSAIEQGVTEALLGGYN